MIQGKTVLAYIPARSGSKSIIDKNIVDICGKPLIAYSIEAAKESKYVDKVIVSTDSKKYAEIAKQYGAEAPFLRPAELASDLAVEMDSCQHMMMWVEENWFHTFDIVLKLEPTSPLRLPEDIDRAIERFVEKNADTVTTVAEVRTPPFWMNQLPPDASLNNFISKDVMRKNRQELPTYYFLDGLVFVAKWDYLKSNKSWFSENSFASITPQNRAIDIDGLLELEMVRIKIKERKENKKLKGEEAVKQLFNLKGKVAVITGAVGLIGSQYAEILSDAGAQVVIVDVFQDKCEEFAKEITKRNGIEALGLYADISNEDSICEMVRKVKQKFGKIDILINNAVAKPKAFFKNFEDYPLSDWEQVMSVNLRGVFLCSKIIGSEMVGQRKGVIINVSSIYGLVGPDQSIYGNSGINAPAVYSASKGGVISLTKYLAAYWGNKGIRINSLCPGGVENNQDSEFIAKYCLKTPLGRMAKPDDFKGALLFLCSDASGYMTGANLVVDGGWTAW